MIPLLLITHSLLGAPGTPAPPQGLLDNTTIFAVYGRAFGVGPILGKLGQLRSIAEMEKAIAAPVKQIDALNGPKRVTPALHLIYNMAIPCKNAKDECLYAVEGAAGDLVANYIRPAAERGWIVILDTQLGRSTPAAQVRQMIAKGYLKYDNVHVAIDPEFRTAATAKRPGIPIGSVHASEVNEAQQALDAYVRAEGLRTRKMLIVHQFGDAAVPDGVPHMIRDKQRLRTFPNVDLVIDMDGLGSPAVKAKKYNLITSAERYPFLRYRAIKVFYPNRWEKHGHFDRPPMEMDQVMGQRPAARGVTIQRSPDVIIIA